MAGLLTTVKANIVGLGNPSTCAGSAAAIDLAYKRLWADVHELGTLAALRAGLLARNALYEGNAIAYIYRSLTSGHPAPWAPATATHLLSILAALLQDVPAAFAAEGYGHFIYEAMDAGELIVPDFSELNAMRAQPVFVTLALETLLARPESRDHDPHVSVGYINDLIGMDGVDYITSTALQALLKDKQFRSVLFRGLHSSDEHKLFKCLQLLKRCVGGGPGKFGGFARIEHQLSPPWSLQQLLELGAEQPLIAACRSVAAMVREHTIERQLLGLLHTTLLDIFELACADDDDDDEGEQSSDAGSSRHGSGRAAAAVVGFAAAQKQAQPTATGAGVAANSGRSGAAGAPAGDCASSSSGRGGVWPEVLVVAHAELLIEVAKLVPFLITSISRMRHYSSTPAAAAALEGLGPAHVMSALIGVLAVGDPTDWLMLQHEVDAYQVVDALAQHSPKLAIAALQAGATDVIHAALLEWASFLPIPSNPDFDSRHGPSQQQRLSRNGSLASKDSSIKGSTDAAAAAAAGAGGGAGRPAGLDGFGDIEVVDVEVTFGQHAEKFVDPHVAEAAAAAVKLLQTLLRAAVADAAAAGPASSSRAATNGDLARTSYSSSGSNKAAARVSDSEARTAAAAAPLEGARAAGESGGDTDGEETAPMHQVHLDLPELLLEFRHIDVLEEAATACLAELAKLELMAGNVAGGSDTTAVTTAAGGGAAAGGGTSRGEECLQQLGRLQL